MTKAITNNIAQNTNTQKILFRILLISLVVLFTGYIYLIGSITFNVIARKTLETKVVNLSSNVNQLDLTYLNNINKIDKEYALSAGFIDTHQNLFVSRNINNVAIR
jgi:hypothetical protein